MLYAQKGKTREAGVGAGPGDQTTDYPDNTWPDNAWLLKQVDGSSYELVNNYSGRKLYAQKGKTWGAGVGAAPAGPKISPENKWLFKRTPDGKYNYEIVNEYSGRKLYAQSGKRWSDGFGAGPADKTYADNIWVFKECH